MSLQGCQAIAKECINAKSSTLKNLQSVAVSVCPADISAAADIEDLAETFVDTRSQTPATARPVWSVAL
eukprot:SAG11_NODE_1387_length_5065_cov_12.530099_2_plen_69_part_00